MTVPRFTATAEGTPSPDMVAAYRRDGVLVIEDFFDAEKRARLVERIDRLVEEFDPATVRTVFSTAEQTHSRDAYFRGSGDKIRYFLEPGAFDAAGALTGPRHRVLNKIGHAMHDLDPGFSEFSRDRALAALAAGLGLRQPALVQSMVIFKQPGIGGEVGLHQDATFLHTDPVSVTGFWVALEDADESNGCLQALPGGHRFGLAERFGYDADGNLTMQRLGTPEWNLRDLESLPAPAGTLVVLHGLVPHRSSANTGPRSRLAYALHAIDRHTAWSQDNWLQRRPDLPFRGFEQ